MKSSASLDTELAALRSTVRADAANVKHRIHLFQLLCVMGRWQRALAQLQLCGQMDAKALAMAQTYREAIRAELFRAEVFAGRRQPSIMGKPPEWVGLLLEALRLETMGETEKGHALRAQALDAAEPVAFQVDGQSVEWLCDGDARLGPTLEVIANGQYYWLPLELMSGLRLEAPTDLRDLVWATGELMLPNEGRVPVLIPARYVGTDALEGAENDALKRSACTRWQNMGDEQWHGLGQRMLVSDVGEHPLLDIREISRAVKTPNAEAATGDR
ncbi:MAG: type VI secretion system accessory protein TagJ [Casimicrobiaceae bacterium]